MSGFVAIIAHDRARPVAEATIEQFAATYEALRGCGTRHTAAAGAYARVIKIDTPAAAQPGIARDGASWTAAAGVVHHCGELADQPIEQLDGQFGLISYDAQTEQLVVATDPCGLFSVYVAHNADATYVSTCALALAKQIGAAPDHFAILTYLRSGGHFGKMTNWQGVERLEPGCAIQFSASGRTPRRYWQPTLDERLGRLSFQQSVDHCIEVVTETFRAYFAGKPQMWTDLTGGYDSRLLNLLMTRAGVDFRTNTIGDPGHIDVRIAQEVARVAGWQWTNFALPQNWGELIDEYLPLAFGWGDSHLEVLRLSQTLWNHAEKSRSARVLATGGGIDLFSGRTWQHALLTASTSSQITLEPFLRVRFLRGSSPTILTSDPTPAIREDFCRRLNDWIAPYSDRLGSVQFDLMSMYKQVSHHGIYSSSAGAFLAMQTPAYLKPVFTAAISTNPNYRNVHKLMRHMIERLDPRVAAVLTHAGSPAAVARPHNMHRFVPYYLRMGRKAITNVSRKYLTRGLLAPAPVFNDRVTAARRAVLDQLNAEQPFSHATMRSAALYKASELDAFLAQARQPDFADTEMLGRVITIERALRTTDAYLDHAPKL